ncbi:GerAB/ArcD/ProY family transporter [Niallia sp. FSL W8-0635]|uniref:GerAB/ArcD/ProY family transporter n=1 Tax=Niallia sp. FSL W8-0635 TaxID=2975337 RepID=UPI002B005155|nr:GerAB/ArcD/ProY family transporter [Yersinia enterocolitica]
MLTEKLSLTQIFTMIINFLLGSSIVVGIGIDAKRDAWLVVLIGMFVGLIIMSFYLYLMSLLPGKNIYEIMEYCFSRKIAVFLALIYLSYFIYIAARIIRDFGELITSAILPATPIEFTIFTLMLVIGYILYLGIEVLGRTAEIFSPYMFLFVFLLFILLYAGDKINLTNVQPILSTGFKPIIKSTFPSIIAFPYGELIAFTVILAHIGDFKVGRKICLISVFIASLILLSSVFLIIATLGENTAVRANFPLLIAARLVSIGEFLERIDVLVVFIMMLGILIKSSVFLYGGLKGIEYIFKLPYRYFAMPVSFIVSMFSIFISLDFSDHIVEGLNVDIFLLHVPLQFAFPIFIVAVLLVKKWKEQRNEKRGLKA